MAGRDNSKAKLLGNLIENARNYARRSEAECAEILGLAPETYAQVEQGAYDLSLPELEALAIYLDVPMGYFWGTASLETEEPIDYESWIDLRQRVIGVLLRQMRIQARQSVEDVADFLEIEPDRLQAYESGELPMPYLQLEAACQMLEGNTLDFLDNERGPMGRHEAKHKLLDQFDRMPPEMQQFLVNPVNVTYLDTAKRISEMDVEKLRQVAENILDITY